MAVEVLRVGGVDVSVGTINVSAVGRVRSERGVAVDDDWDGIAARIELDPELFDGDALKGLESFSHIEVVFVFDQVDEKAIVTGARRPRGRADWPEVGIFAQRGRVRPNRLAVTACRLVAVDGLTLHVQGLDAIDQTPVLDIKPVMTGFLPRGEVREPPWAVEIMSHYWD